MTNKYQGSCFLAYVCAWYQWNIVPQGEQYKVYKLNNRGFEVDFEFSSKSFTHTVTYSDSNLNGNMNLVVAEGLVVPMSIVSSTGAEKYFSEHIVEVGDKYYDVNAADLNLPTKNRIGDLQIDSEGKATIDRLSIVCR